MGESALCVFQWDEALLTMSKGEKAQLEIEPEWAYGKKGQPDAKYPSSAPKCSVTGRCWLGASALGRGQECSLPCCS